MTAPRPRAARRPGSPRRPRAGGDLRVLRAAVFAAVCVVLAGAGHALASCATIPLWSLGIGFTGVFAVAAALAGRERSLPAITAMLAVGQTLLHTLFGLGQHGTAVASRTTEALDAALVERAARFVCGTTAAALSPAQARQILIDAGVGGTHATHHPADAMTTAAGSSAAVLPSLPMLLGHVLAAVAAGWVLRHGDLALLRLVRLPAHESLVGALRGALALARALRSGLTGAPATVSCAPRAVYAAPAALRTTALQHTLVRRGPPTAPALALAA